MKKFLFMLVAMFAMSTAAFAQKGVTAFGVQGAYDDLFGQFGLGVKVQQGFADQFRAEVGGDFFFKKNGVSMFDVNANFHFVVPVVADKFNVYPLAGANISFGSLDDDIVTVAAIGGVDLSKSKTRIGLNLGGGVEYFVTDNVKIVGEAKYIISDNGWSRFGANVGVAFLF
jgi:outer membrane protein X